MLPFLIPAAAQAATGLISGISGLFQKAKANRLERENVRPTYNIPQEIRANQQIAQQQATMGMPGAQYEQGLRNINRNTNNMMAAAQDRRGGLAAVGAAQQAANDASLNLTAMDAQQRVSNIRNLMAQNNAMAQYRDKQWGWNQQAKYQENAAAIRALRGAGNANLNTGLNGIIGAGMTVGENMLGGGTTGQQGTTGTGTGRMQAGDFYNTGTWNQEALPYNDFRIPRR
jgi:hypothetical protein